MGDAGAGPSPAAGPSPTRTTTTGSDASKNLPMLAPAHPIVTERLTMRPMRVADIEPVVEYRSRPAVYGFLSHGDAGRSRLEAKFQHRIARMSMPSDNATEVQLVIERDGRVIGDCGFRITRAWTKDDAPADQLVARVHYALDDTATGQGYGSEAVRALVAYLFDGGSSDSATVHRIQADVFAENAASRRLLERLGFRCEGYFVDDGIIDGRFVDATIYSLLRREWDGAGIATT